MREEECERGRDKQVGLETFPVLGSWFISGRMWLVIHFPLRSFRVKEKRIE